MAATLDATLGAALIGAIVAALLHGISCGQAFYYYTHVGEYKGSRDRWFGVKGVVLAIILFDTMHQALISHTVYYYVITSYGNPASLQFTTWSLLLEVLFNGFTAFLVQSFLALRVYRLSEGSLPVTILVAALVLAEFGCVTAFAIIGLSNPLTFAFLATLQKLSVVVNALAAAGDVCITITLVWLLRFKSRGFRRSEKMVNTLISYTVTTGLLTAACAVSSLVSIVLRPDAFIYIAFFFCLGRLYTNSLLATLNSRRGIRQSTSGQAIVMSGSSAKFSSHGGTTQKSSVSGEPKEQDTDSIEKAAYGLTDCVHDIGPGGPPSLAKPPSSFRGMRVHGRRDSSGKVPSVSGISVQIATTRAYTDDPYPIRTPPSTETFGRVSPFPGVDRIEKIIVTDDENDATIETHHV